MYNYDRNIGGCPNIGDRVEFCHTSCDMDGMRGRIGSWGDPTKMIALVILDTPYAYPNSYQSVEVVGMPVVCLRKIDLI